jgi:hypothetical protein
VLHQLEVGQRRRPSQRVKPSGQQQRALHGQDVLGSIGIVADINKILNLGDLVGLGVFGCDPESRDAQQLQSASGDLFPGEIEVDESDHEEVGFAHEFVLLVHLHQPVEEHSAHVLAELALHLEVVANNGSDFAHHEALDVSAVELLLRGGFERRFAEGGEGLVGRVVLVPARLHLLLRRDMAGLAKFHSKE